MVVDDELAILTVLKRILSPAHDVFAFGNAALAIEAIARGERYDVILCDLMMPTITGVDFFDRLALIAPGQEQRIVFLTGGAFTDSARSFIARVDNLVLDKPLSVEGLKAVIRSACGSSDAPPRIPTKRDGGKR
jgi:CheY-like chemotaxis protein